MNYENYCFFYKIIDLYARVTTHDKNLQSKVILLFLVDETTKSNIFNRSLKLRNN